MRSGSSKASEQGNLDRLTITEPYLEEDTTRENDDE